MAWFWPTHRVERWTETSGVNEVVELQEQKQGILLIGIHFLTLELGARMFGMFTPGIGVYRPNDNPLIDWLQTWGRLRSNKTMLDRKNLKGMVKSLKEGEILWYAPDHDYGRASSVFVPFSMWIMLRPPPVPGCWRECQKPPSFLLFREESPTAPDMNSSRCSQRRRRRWILRKLPPTG